MSSLFNVVWRKYGLKDNPYFMEPLTIEGDIIPISALVGRNEETKLLIDRINIGGGRAFLVVGNAGVGKTSLLNYVRNQAREGQFFSPVDEIELNYPMSCQQFVIETLSALYREVKRVPFKLSQEVERDLSSLNSLFSIAKNLNDTDNYSRLNYVLLRELFKRTVKEIIEPRYKGIILHYDNLDNIKDKEDLKYMLGEIRDLLVTNKVAFFFVGDKFLQEDIGYDRRVREIFYMPPVDVPELNIETISEILDNRIKALAIKGVNPIKPHTIESLKILFKIHKGNLREMLNSLTVCVVELANTNSPIKIDEFTLRNTLLRKIERDYLAGLTEVERGILIKMLEYEKPITPIELSRITKKAVQNIASKYLPKLRNKRVVEFVGKDRKNTYYKPILEIKWLRLKDGEDKNKKHEEMEEFIQNNLTKWLK